MSDEESMSQIAPLADGVRLIGNRYALTKDNPREGGMSLVYRAYDVLEGRPCAIKRVKGGLDNLRWKESFNREYGALSDLCSHPCIVSMYEAGKDDEGFYIVLEWLPRNLADLIAEAGPLRWSEFYPKIGRPILEALAYAQGRGWNHRDIKPENILLSDGGDPRISDYGIAKQVEKPVVGLTLAHYRSAPFTPPEDDSGNWSSSRDCFSWAAVAVYAMSGVAPKDYGALSNQLAVLDATQAPVSILQTALSHTPEERPPLASAMLAELDAFELARISASKAIYQCHLYIDPECLNRVTRALDAADRSQVEASLLEELREVKVGLKSFQEDGEVGVRIAAVTWTLEGWRALGRLVIRKAWQSRPAEVERHRETGFRPLVDFTFRAPPDPVVAAANLENLFLAISAFEAEERDRAALARRERIFRLWYAFLRSKAEYEARRENAITYIDVKLHAASLSLITDLAAPPEIVGQSRVIRLVSGRHLFCDVIDVTLDEVIVTVIDYAPVALPLFRLTVDAVTLVHRDIPPIKEFVMRSIRSGIGAADDIAGFLGLDFSTVDATFDQLSGERYVTPRNDSGAVTLLDRGREVLDRAMESAAQDEMLVFLYDRLLQKPVRLPPEQLFAPREIDPMKVIEIRPYPAEGPELQDLSIPEISLVLQEQAGGRAAFGRDLLRLKRIVRRVRIYRTGVGLVYKRVRSSDIQIAFIVDDARDEALDSLAAALDSNKTAESCASRLLELALRNGGQDNISIVVVRHQ